MKENGVFLIKKELEGIDINLHVVRITRGVISAPAVAELTDVSDSVYFAVKGKCNVVLSGKEYTVESGTAFYAASNGKVHCRQIGDEAFEYFSITIGSLDCRNVFARMNLSKAQPILHFDDSIEGRLAKLYETAQKGTVASVYAGISQLYAILSELAERNSSQAQNDIENEYNEYVERAVAFMGEKYYDDISVNAIADALKINRSYFSVLFKKTMGVSPMRYLTELRISQACKLLAMGKTVVDTAILTGYNTPANFGYNFKRIMHMSPNEYKKKTCKQEPKGGND